MVEEGNAIHIADPWCTRSQRLHGAERRELVVQPWTEHEVVVQSPEGRRLYIKETQLEVQDLVRLHSGLRRQERHEPRVMIFLSACGIAGGLIQCCRRHAQDGDHVCLEVGLEVGVQLAVEVDREGRDAEDGLVNPDELGYEARVAVGDNDASSDREVAVPPADREDDEEMARATNIPCMPQS